MSDDVPPNVAEYKLKSASDMHQLRSPFFGENRRCVGRIRTLGYWMQPSHFCYYAYERERVNLHVSLIGYTVVGRPA
jgi:hypothetical protein